MKHNFVQVTFTLFNDDATGKYSEHVMFTVVPVEQYNSLREMGKAIYNIVRNKIKETRFRDYDFGTIEDFKDVTNLINPETFDYDNLIITKGNWW